MVGERLGTEGIRRVCIGCYHVVAQSERVAHLMAGYESGCIAYQGFWQFILACLLVVGSCLHHDPFAQERLHVVPPDDVCLQNLACSRVDDGRTHGVRLL